MPKASNREVGARLVQSILNDEDLEHLTVLDLRNVLLNLQDVFEYQIEKDAEESEEDLKRHIL